jgi:hypothetical protein
MPATSQVRGLPVSVNAPGNGLPRIAAANVRSPIAGTTQCTPGTPSSRPVLGVVPRFRSSSSIAATSDTNFGSKGALATL